MSSNPSTVYWMDCHLLQAKEKDSGLKNEENFDFNLYKMSKILLTYFEWQKRLLNVAQVLVGHIY